MTSDQIIDGSIDGRVLSCLVFCLQNVNHREALYFLDHSIRCAEVRLGQEIGYSLSLSL